MYCSKCGSEVNEDSVICPKCGCYIKQPPTAKTEPQTNDYSKSKTGIGVLCGLFLGLIGLVIGICIFPENTESRRTFLKGWVIAFVVTIALSLLSVGIMSCAISSYY